MDFRVLLGMNLHSVNHLIEDHEGQLVFRALISKNSSRFLLSHIMFDDFADRQKNWPTDRFAAMQLIQHLFNTNFTKYVTPSDFLNIDETLYSTRHQIVFRQYNPNKTQKYGVLWKILNDSRFPYTCNSVTSQSWNSAGIYDPKHREVFSKTYHFKLKRKDLCLKSYTVNPKSKGKKVGSH